jgi:RNA polymerase sigma-70 factor (ECF subfamily)
MANLELETLYQRFASHGDVGALAEVFDRVAPDLVRVARRLVGDRHQAEDLVQEAFLTAVEQPELFDPSRALAPWLVGVLVNRAREARRSQERQVEPDRLTERVVPPPDLLAARREHQDAVDAAVSELPPSLRVVVEAKLAGSETAALATRLGLSRGAVRIRLHRGLERLRRALPTGLASLFVALFLHSQGLARVRVRVLETASHHPLAHGAGGLIGGLGIGSVILVKKLIAVAGVLVLVFAGALFLRGLEPASNDLPPDSPGDPAREVASLDEPTPVARGAPQAAPDLDAEAPHPGRAAVTPQPTPPTESGTTTVLGQVVDENEHALVGATVTLSAYKEWAPGAEAHPLAGQLVGWTTATDADGHFRFDVPEPANPRTQLAIEPDAFHEAWSLRFGSGPRYGDPSLGKGVCDVGLVRLGPAGVIRGTVTNPSGQPIVGAKLFLSTKGYDTLGHDTETDANGGWTMPHVTPGIFGVSVRAPEFVKVFHPGINVVRDRTSEPVTIVIEPAKRFEGHVLTPGGQPVAGAEVTAWPLDSDASGTRSPGYTRSGADGSFTVFLQQPGLHSLTADLEGFILPTSTPRTETYEPGRTDITLILEPLPSVVFRVLDTTTGEPISPFTLHIEITPPEDDGSMTFTSSSKPRLEDHPSGEAAAGARVGVDRVSISAPGYHSTNRLVSLDAPLERTDGPATMTLKLPPLDPAERAPRLVGRVLEAGTPVANARVTLLPGRAQASTKAPFTLGFGTPLATSTDAEGRFAFQDATPSPYSLRVRVADGLGVKIDGVRGPWKSDVDVGDLEVETTATLHGRVILPAGLSPSGLQIFLDGEASPVKTLIDEHGEFTLEGIIAGSHQLFSGPIMGKLDGGDGLALDLRPGERRELELDLTGLSLLHVALTLTLDGEPLPKAKVTFHRLTAGPALQAPLKSALGDFSSDEHGRVSGTVRALGQAWIELEGRQLGTLIAPERITLEAGHDLTLELDLVSSSLALRLPPEVRIPDAGSLRIELVPLEATTSDPGARLFAKAGAGPTPPAFTFDTVSPGRFHLAGALIEKRDRSTDDILSGVQPYAEVASGSEDITIAATPTTIQLHL